MATGAALIIGAGIAGIACALELAQRGIRVYLCDRRPAAGGTLVQLDRWFPDNHCGMCQALPAVLRDDAAAFCLRRGFEHPDIEFLPLSEVTAVAGAAGDFRVTMRMNPGGVDRERCTGCGQCSRVCPVESSSRFDAGMSAQKAIDLYHPLAAPNSYAIDWEACTRCGRCVQACPTGAVDLSSEEKMRQLDVGAIVLTAGSEAFDPQAWTAYGYRRYPNVITSVELERMLSPTGPYAGKLIRPSDGAAPGSVAFLQCIGCRTAERDYCASACCMYALKEAVLAREGDPRLDVHIFFMDMRAFGKGYHQYYEQAVRDPGIHFHRCRIPVVKEHPRTREIVLSVQGEAGGVEPRAFDLAVLSVGQAPAPRFETLSRLLGIALNAWGFARTPEFAPVQTSREGIFVCGAASAPKDIADTIVEAGAAACQVSALLSPAQDLPAGCGDHLPEIDLRDDEARTAVCLCRCGDEIASVLDMEGLAEFARNMAGVVCVEDISYLCLEEGLNRMTAAVKGHKANRVIAAACAAFPYYRRMMAAAGEAGIDASRLEVVDFRHQLSRVHRHNGEAATEKAKRLLAVALEKVRGQAPLPAIPRDLTRCALVLGGGLAGLTAAQSLAAQGIACHLVEREAELGGNLRQIRTTLAGGDPGALLRKRIEEAGAEPLIRIHPESEMTAISGYAGAFEVSVRDRDGGTDDFKAGAIVIATGGRPHEPEEYLYGKSERVITQRELEQRLAENRVEGVRAVLMIQCVGARDSNRPYCSRVCCAQALKNALALKAMRPETEVFICYRDMMSYGFREAYYTRAREKGVVFIRYEPDRKPEVRLEGDRVRVSVVDPVLGDRLQIDPDLLVLTTGIVPEEAGAIAGMLDLDLTEDGFFREAEAKFRPVDLLREGVFVCGLARSPGDMGETIAQAQAAAQRATVFLLGKRPVSARTASKVSEWRCSGCGQCLSACAYGARVMDAEKGIVTVIASLCRGCGACAAACPNGAAQMVGFSDQVMFSMLDAAI